MRHETEFLNDFADGMLNSEDEDRIQRHLAECDECRKDFESIRSLKNKAASLPMDIQPKRDLWSGIESRISKPSGILLFPESMRRPLNRRVMRWMQYTLAAAAIVAVAIFGMVWLRYYSSSSWKMELVESGSTGAITKHDELRVGDVLQTDSATRATIQVGAIGFVNVEPNSTVRLLEAAATDHRLALDKGTLHATIFAPPRLFFVETPSALAVDLGCAYTMTVDEKGASFLEVTSGWVALEYGGRESIIPAGAMCATKPGFGPGTPFQQDASPELREALLSYDFGLADSASLAVVLRQARNMDSITLWHLLFRTTGDARARVYDRLAFLVPPPEGVTRSGMLEGNRAMVEKWQKYLNLGNSSWWRFWVI